MLNLALDTSTIRPAAYNPRAISHDALENLKRSISELGFCKPIIVQDDGLIIAGHQRSKAANALGLATVPAWIVESVAGEEDQIMFNQLHNGTDLDEIGEEKVFVPAIDHAPDGTFEEVAPDDVRGSLRAPGAMVRADICHLLLHYGNWGCAVATQGGLVVSSQQYALACKQLGIPTRVFRVADDKVQDAMRWFSIQYGKFSYDHLSKEAYVQSFAQPFRLRGKDGKPGAQSQLYRDWLYPVLRPESRVLDFGCGQADHLKKLQREGFQAHGIEFFPRPPGKGAIDTRASRIFIDDTLHAWVTKGPFDVVICDSVINSVQTLDAETDVGTCVNLFAKLGGWMLMSGRPMAELEYHKRTQASGTKAFRRSMEFVDDNGFGAIKQHGSWFFQMWHDEAQVVEMGQRFGYDTDFRYNYNDHKWNTRGRKARQLPEAQVEAAIRREFELMWPRGRTVGRSEACLAAWREVQRKWPEDWAPEHQRTSERCA